MFDPRGRGRVGVGQRSTRARRLLARAGSRHSAANGGGGRDWPAGNTVGETIGADSRYCVRVIIDNN